MWVPISLGPSVGRTEDSEEHQGQYADVHRNANGLLHFPGSPHCELLVYLTKPANALRGSRKPETKAKARTQSLRI
jgi:hypothetical protein